MRSALEEHPRGSRAMTRAERWQRARALCLPSYCIYAHACPEGSGRQHYLLASACLRHRPEEERPPAGLSAVARRALGRPREGAV